MDFILNTKKKGSHTQRAEDTLNKEQESNDLKFWKVYFSFFFFSSPVEFLIVLFSSQHIYFITVTIQHWCMI